MATPSPATIGEAVAHASRALMWTVAVIAQVMNAGLTWGLVCICKPRTPSFFSRVPWRLPLLLSLGVYMSLLLALRSYLHLFLPRPSPSSRPPATSPVSAPLATVLSLAGECGLVLSSTSPDDSDAVEASTKAMPALSARNVPATLPPKACGHELCVKCALDLCSVIKSYDVPGIAGAIPCPLCRSCIASFRRRPAAEEAEPEPDVNAACKNCGGGDGDHRASSSSGTEKVPADECRSYGAAATMDSEAIVPLYRVAPSAVLY
ncbi:hypothetical protein ACP70R_042214 [Stipagrostis hirtigluma subsp. patula]